GEGRSTSSTTSGLPWAGRRAARGRGESVVMAPSSWFSRFRRIRTFSKDPNSFVTRPGNRPNRETATGSPSRAAGSPPAPVARETRFLGRRGARCRRYPAEGRTRDSGPRPEPEATRRCGSGAGRGPAPGSGIREGLEEAEVQAEEPAAGGERRRAAGAAAGAAEDAPERAAERELAGRSGDD